MKEQRPSATAQACLDEIVAAGVARREEGSDGSVAYVPLVDCSPLIGWLAARLGDERLGFTLAEKATPGAREGFSIDVAGPPLAVEAAREAARPVGKARTKGGKQSWKTA